MADLVEQFNQWAEGWLALVGAVLWQSTLLAGLIAVVGLLLRRASPRVRYWLWQILAIKLLLMPFWTLAIPFPWFPDENPAAQSRPKAHGSQPVGTGAEPPSMPSIPAPAAEPSPMTEQPPRPPWFEPLTWQAWLLAVWLAAITWQTARLIRQRIQLGRLLRSAQSADELRMDPTGPPFSGGASPRAPAMGRPLNGKTGNGDGQRLINLVNDSADQLGLKRLPAVLVTETDGSPFACGLWRPKLVLPGKLIDTLDESRLRHVLLHELAHVKRRDLIFGWLPYIARLVWFFHPIAWWAAWKVRLEQELACDQLVMSTAGTDAADYAETLLQVVTHASEPTVLKTAALPSSYLTAGKAPQAHGWQPVGPNQNRHPGGSDDEQSNDKEPEP